MQQDSTQEATLKRLEEAEQLKLNGQHEEALRILEELLVEDPANSSALEEVADNELSLERFDRAEAAAKRAITIDPQSYMGHYILGYLYTIRNEWEKAINKLREANILQPNNPEILRCLGWALFSTGKRTQGIVTMERALNLDSENPLTLCDLGAAYLKAQNITKAKALLLKSLDIDPENARTRQCVHAVEKIEELQRSRRDAPKMRAA